MQHPHPRRKTQPRARQVAANPDPVLITRADLHDEVAASWTRLDEFERRLMRWFVVVVTVVTLWLFFG